MRKWLSFSLLFLLSISFAAPLIGTKSSFAESNFCKHYKCEYVGTDSMDVGKLLHYVLPDGAEIEVGRDNDTNIIEFMTLYYRNQALSSLINKRAKGAPYLKDLIKTATGANISYDLYNQCVKSYDSNNEASFGKTVKAGMFKISCSGASSSGASRAGMSPTPTIVFNILQSF